MQSTVVMLDAQRQEEAAAGLEFSSSLSVFRMLNAAQPDYGFGRDRGQNRVGALDVQREVKHGVLDVHIHHGLGIQNISMYDDQDVYAKLCLTHSDAEALRTKIVIGGGRDPVFDQSFQIAIRHPEPVLKCEIWMSSRNRRYLEDQMLAFVLVPLAPVLEKGKHFQDYELSSTELFHSPAGIVRLTLVFLQQLTCPRCPPYVNLPQHVHMSNDNMSQFAYNGNQENGSSLSTFSDMNLMISDSDAISVSYDMESFTSLNVPVSSMDLSVGQRGDSAMLGCVPHNLYRKVQYPDVQLVCDNQQLVSDFLTLASTDSRLDCPSESICYGKDSGVDEVRMQADPSQLSFMEGPFLQLGSFDVSSPDYNMVDTADGELKKAECSLRDGLVYETTLPQIEDCRLYQATTSTSFESLRHGSSVFSRSDSSISYASATSCAVDATTCRLPQTLSWAGSNSCFSSSIARLASSSDGDLQPLSQNMPTLGRTHSSSTMTPLASVDKEVIQQDIVDLYTKNLQLFTESIATMPLLVSKDLSQSWKEPEPPISDLRRKLSSRVFYGSRAFF